VVKTYEARRPLRIGNGTRQIGEPVPEAHLWRLTTGLVTGGKLSEIEVSDKDFTIAITEHCPDQAEEIYASVGVEPVDLEATGTTEPRSKRRVVKSAPVPVSKAKPAGA
jgi:hypothetical protein